jgi:hypothetical protein
LRLSQAAQVGSWGIVASLTPSQYEEYGHIDKRQECDRYQGGNQSCTKTPSSQ